jgi:hypothetical protein
MKSFRREKMFHIILTYALLSACQPVDDCSRRNPSATSQNPPYPSLHLSMRHHFTATPRYHANNFLVETMNQIFLILTSQEEFTSSVEATPTLLFSSLSSFAVECLGDHTFFISHSFLSTQIKRISTTGENGYQRENHRFHRPRKRLLPSRRQPTKRWL